MKINSYDKTFFEFIEVNAKEDLSKLKLKYHGKSLPFDLDFALLQIECRRKYATKMKNFLSNSNVVFPSILAAEQASHESIATFHASIIGNSERSIDMTSGLGIDAFAIARNSGSLIACELDPERFKALTYNKEILGLFNITVVNGDSVRFISDSRNHFNTVFIDPARRNKNGRVYNFKDCQPDVIPLIKELRNKADRIFIKASPLLDISQTIRDIPDLTAIRAVSVMGECKEILVEINNLCYNSEDNPIPIVAEAVDLNNNNGEISSRFTYKIPRINDRLACVPQSYNDISTDNPINSIYNGILYAGKEDISPGNYIYEPNAPMMKLAPWNALSTSYPSIKKLSPSSHLFVSTEFIPDFPGRKLLIDSLPDKKSRKSLHGKPINIVTRNYPVAPDILRKQLGVKEGDLDFLYASRLDKTPIFILCHKL